MTVIEDIAFVRYSAPDLDTMEQFLLDFGLRRSIRTAEALYMRALGTAHHVHITELGDEPATLGFGLRARSADDLAKLAAEVGARVEDNPEPGGGQRVRFRDPVGYLVDVIHGQSTVAPIAYRDPIPPNPSVGRSRLGRSVRLKPGPSNAVRLGHVFIQTTDLKASLEFYTRVLGFKISDTYFAGSPDNTVAAFLHCGLGQTWTDHHTLGVGAAQDGQNRFDHAAFEVVDLDDVAQGNAYLKAKGYRHAWGVGRHIQGSQIFDYWRDPWGHKVEHWTDGDLVNDDTPVSHAQITPQELAQWAPEFNPEFFQ